MSKFPIPPLLRAASALVFVPLCAAQTIANGTNPPTAPAPETLPVAPKTAAQHAALAAWVENDFKWSDKYYTNGIKLAYTSPALFDNGTAPAFFEIFAAITPLASPTGATPAEWRFSAGIAQEIYTAKDEYIANPPLDDHPYAGLLYGSFALSSETNSRLDVLELSLGVIGPSSLAKQTQNNWHHLIGDPIVGGWETQLHNEPLVQLAWDRFGRYSLVQGESFGIDVIPHIHAEVGTVRIYGAVGAQFRLGWHLPQDFGVRFMRDTNGTTRPARDADYNAPLHWLPDSFYFFLDARGEGWAWNSTVDGNVWFDSREVESRPWIGQGAIGFSAHWGAWKLDFSQVVRSKDFDTQDHSVFVFSSIALGVVF